MDANASPNYDFDEDSKPTARWTGGKSPAKASMPGKLAPSGPVPSLGTIDHYRLVRKLGGGGFGVVYLAVDTVSGLEVAIKTLHPMLKCDTGEMDALREKFALVSRLAHPHIATALVLHPVRDVDITDDCARRELQLSSGDSVMVMRYAAGIPLSRWRLQFPDGIVPPDEAMVIARQIAGALDHAHSMQVIHRDVKPANIMVEMREGVESRSESQAASRLPASVAPSLCVRLLDFGLAAEIRSSMARHAAGGGDTSGTRPYMAPEQWAGRGQDGRTDQYALACVVYELLSGAPPFASAFETRDVEVMRLAVETRAPECIHAISREANDILARALAKNPDDRFESCGAFVESLSAALAQTSAAAGDGRPRSEHGNGKRSNEPGALAGAQGVRGTPQSFAGNVPGRSLKRFTRVLAMFAIAMVAFLAIRGLWPSRESLPAPTPPIHGIFSPNEVPSTNPVASTIPDVATNPVGPADPVVATNQTDALAAKTWEEQAKAEVEALEKMLAPWEENGTLDECFAKVLDKAGNALKQGAAMREKGNSTKAASHFEAGKKGAESCGKLLPIWDAARQARDAALEAWGGEKQANGTEWKQGEDAMEKASSACAKTRFAEAGTEWSRAKNAYEKSVVAAHKAKVEQGLDAASAARRTQQWKKVAEECRKVLELEPGNEKAKEWMTEAERRLRPPDKPVPVSKSGDLEKELDDLQNELERRDRAILGDGCDYERLSGLAESRQALNAAKDLRAAGKLEEARMQYKRAAILYEFAPVEMEISDLDRSLHGDYSDLEILERLAPPRAAWHEGRNLRDAGRIDDARAKYDEAKRLYMEWERRRQGLAIHGLK